MLYKSKTERKYRCCADVNFANFRHFLHRPRSRLLPYWTFFATHSADIQSSHLPALKDLGPSNLLPGTNSGPPQRTSKKQRGKPTETATLRSHCASIALNPDPRELVSGLQSSKDMNDSVFVYRRGWPTLLALGHVVCLHACGQLAVVLG